MFRDSKIIRGALSCRCSSSLRNFGVEQVLSRTKRKLRWRLLLLLLLLNLIGEQQQNGCAPFVSISGLLLRWRWLWLWLSLSLLSHSRATAHTIVVVTAIAKIPLHRGASSKKFAMHVSGLTKRSFAQAMAGVAATEQAPAKAGQKKPTEKEMREPSTAIAKVTEFMG